MDYVVRIEVSVTADSPEEAARFALADLQDTGLGPWSVDVQGSSGSAPKTVSVSQTEIDHAR